MSLRFRPMANRVVVRLIDPPKTTSGGIYFPDNIGERDPQDACMGEVMAVGPGMRNVKTGQRVPIEVKVGQHVMLYWTAIKIHGTLMEEDGQEYLVIEDDYIRCEFEPEVA